MNSNMTHHKMSNKIISLINQTHLTITKQNIVSPQQFILITVSGGQDSLCLFFILLNLKKQWKWHFGLLYCNHFWQIDSFYINSLIFKLGFLFLIPAYLSLPSENIFSEQKSRTWRYRQFNRLSTFYKYDIIFTGHTSTDKIETVLLQLLRGTGTRGLSTLDWIRPISRYNPVASPFALKLLPLAVIARATANVSSFLGVLTQTNKPATILKNNNMSFSHKLFQIEFCNHFFLSSQINCLKDNFFSKAKIPQLISYKKFGEFLENYAFPIKSKNNVLLERHNFLNNEPLPGPAGQRQSGSQKLFVNVSLSLPFPRALLPTLVVGTKNVKIKEQVGKTGCDYTTNWSTKLFVISKTKTFNRVSKVTRLVFKPSFINLFFQSEFSYGEILYDKNIRRNTVTLQRNWKKISYRNTNWISDDFLFLTLEKIPVLIPIDKLRYFYLKQNWLFPVSGNAGYSIFNNYKDLFQLNALNNLSSIQQQKLIKLEPNLSSTILGILLINLLQTKSTTFNAQFARRTPFIIHRRIIFKDYSDTRLVSAVTKKIQFFFSLTSSKKPYLVVKRKFQHYNVSSKNKRSFFTFKGVTLNQKASKVLIKYFKISSWTQFKINFLELEVLQLKYVLNFQITPLENLILFLNTNKKVESIFSQAAQSNLKTQRQGYNWDKSSFFCRTSLFNLLGTLAWPPCRNRQGNGKRRRLFFCAPLLTSPLPHPLGWRLVAERRKKVQGLCEASTKFSKLPTLPLPHPVFALPGIQPKVVNLTTNEVSSLGQARVGWRLVTKVRPSDEAPFAFALPGIQPKVVNLTTNEVSSEVFTGDKDQWAQKKSLLRLPLPCRLRQGGRAKAKNSMKKENNFKETQNNVKFNKTPNLAVPLSVTARATRTKFKIGSNYDYLYLKDKKCVPFWFELERQEKKRPLYKIKDHKIFLSLHNKYDLSIKISKNVRLVLPIQKGFSWSKRYTKQSFLVRPLLFVTRFDLKKVCAFWKLPVYPDQTNEKLVYFRNRIRKQLLPLLRFFFNPQIDKLFLQFAEIATTEQLYLDELTIHLQNKLETGKINTFKLNFSVFHFIPLAIQRRLLKQFLNQHFTRQIKFFHIKILLNVLGKKRKSHFNLYEKLTYKKNLLIRQNFKVEYQMFSNVVFKESSNTISMAEDKFLDKSEVNNLITKIKSEFLQHFIFIKHSSNTRAKVRRNLVNLDKKLNVQNIFSSKNKLKTPQIFFFAGVGACFMTSHHFILLSNFIRV